LRKYTKEIQKVRKVKMTRISFSITASSVGIGRSVQARGGKRGKINVFYRLCVFARHSAALPVDSCQLVGRQRAGRLSQALYTFCRDVNERFATYRTATELVDTPSQHPPPRKISKFKNGGKFVSITHVHSSAIYKQGENKVLLHDTS